VIVTRFIFFVFYLYIGVATVYGNEPWRDLFDGKTLNGWSQKGGKAIYTVAGGQIVGESVANTPNSFMCTTQHYGDFILSLEFKVDNKLNSGVQVRSNSFPEYRDGRVHGYQVEIDPSKRAWTGGIFDEGRRGWLFRLDDNRAAREALKHEQWNLFRVECIGNTIKTWINGVPASHLYDTRTASGFIALQVHGVGKHKEKIGAKVAWRRIRIIDKGAVSYATPSSLPVKNVDNTICNKDTVLLWDGKTTQGWRSAGGTDFPTTGWTIKDGILTVNGDVVQKRGGDIVTTKMYENFEFEIDFKLTPGANSGIKYFVDPKVGASIGLEYQLLDDMRHHDARKSIHEGSRALAGLYDLLPADKYLKHVNHIGQWNHAKIVVNDNSVEHWLNGRRVLAFERKTAAFRKLISESKYKKYKTFGELTQGHILLQDHKDEVSFKNIKIKPLK